MKKRLCMFLICWLPCFVMAANIMTMQMLLPSSMPASQHEMTTSVHDMQEMPCHEQMTEHADQSAIHHCAVCGFCVVSSGAALWHAFPTLSVLTSHSVAPVFVAAPVHSQTYPPAIRPPIFS